MKRKILFMLSTWQEVYSQVILKGIEKAIENIDVEIHIVNAYGSEEEYFAKELETFDLVDVQKYDGVMMLLNGVGAGEALEEYAAKCIKYNIPCVSIDIPFPGISYCGIDNYRSMYNLTEHLIKEHNITKLQYIGGPENHHDSIERGKAFLDCLKNNGLEPYGFSYYGYMRSSGRKAYEDVKASNRPMAEAYVCANDYCALGFCNAAKEDGLEPPDDFIITGFDNQPEGMNYFPSITSVDRNLDELGRESILHLLNIIDGTAGMDSQKCISGRVTKGGSCGCEKERNLSVQYLELNNILMKRNVNDTLQKSTREMLCGNDTFMQYQKKLQKCISEKGLVDYRIGVNHYIFQSDCAKTVGYDDVIEVYGANTYVKLNRNEELIPDDFRDDTTKIYWFGTLHCKEKTLGYSIFKYSSAILDFQYHRTINETASLAVENIRQSIILNEMNQKLERLYITDSLTGLYNRFGFNTLAKDLYIKNHGRVYIAFIDMDNLKIMNDTYGHNYGDLAIKGVAEAVSHVYSDTELKVRMGGDEFLVMGTFVSETVLIEKENMIGEYLKGYVEKTNLPMALEVSTGYSFSDLSNVSDSSKLESMLQTADIRMYEKKQLKKKKQKK